MSLLLGVSLLAGAAPGPAGMGPPPQAPIAEPWPAPRPLTVLKQPDWGDYNVYPPAARRRDQEGRVTAETLVGEDGIPRKCRILETSGHTELDQGTCDLLMQVRYAPPRDENGRAVEASKAARLEWLLTVETPLDPVHLVAALELTDGAVTDCRVTAQGPIPSHWRRTICPTLRTEAAYYLGERRYGAGRATISIALRPDALQAREGEDVGAPALPQLAGEVVARRQIRFRVNEDGDPVDCRNDADTGFGTPRTDHRTRCGFFLTGIWFAPAEDPALPRTATFELKVHMGE